MKCLICGEASPEMVMMDPVAPKTNAHHRLWNRVGPVCKRHALDLDPRLDALMSLECQRWNNNSKALGFKDSGFWIPQAVAVAPVPQVSESPVAPVQEREKKARAPMSEEWKQAARERLAKGRATAAANRAAREQVAT